ncbi:MAG: hypothetical protein ACLQVD_20355 [Capsulimonadaceae bacterium]
MPPGEVGTVQFSRSIDAPTSTSPYVNYYLWDTSNNLCQSRSDEVYDGSGNVRMSMMHCFEL